jgi:hypothetical protein
MRRVPHVLGLTLLVLALTAHAALAQGTHDGGEGWVGETNDKIVTNFGFGVIAFFPLFILTASLIQWRLDKRKERRMTAARERRERESMRAGR